MKPQNTPPNGTQPAPSVRRPQGSQRAQTRATMSTEYQERYLPPRCHTAVISTSTQKLPYHSLKATGADMPTFKSFYVTHKWIQNPPKPPQPSMAPKGQRRCSSAPQNPVPGIKVEDYTSVYKNDFRAWKAHQRKPFRLNDSLKVNQGLVVTNLPTKKQAQKDSVPSNPKAVPPVREPQPFESMTCYRSDYIPHTIQPRNPKKNIPQKSNKASPLETAASAKPKVNWDLDQELFDGASELFQQFKAWSLGNKLPQGKGKGRETAADDHFLSTTHADYTAHKCQRTKPIVPSNNNTEKSTESFHTTTTMKEDYKAWETPTGLAALRKARLEKSKKTSFSLCPAMPAAECKTNPKPCFQPKLNQNSCCEDDQSQCQAQCPAEIGGCSGYECITTDNEERERFWTSSMEGGTWPNGDDMCDPSETHIIRCMVSSAN